MSVVNNFTCRKYCVKFDTENETKVHCSYPRDFPAYNAAVHASKQIIPRSIVAAYW